MCSSCHGSSKRGPRDLNLIAAGIVAAATGQDAAAAAAADGTDPNAVALRRKGGPARAAKLTPERRNEIAKLAAAKRWERPEVG